MSSTTTYGLIQTATRKAGATIPSSLADRLAHLAAVADTELGTTRNAATAELVTATAKALDAGRDPFTDKAVAAVLARQQLASATNWDVALRAWQEEQAATALAEHAENLLKEWVGLIGRAGADLAGALDHLDKTPTLEEQAATALRAGGKRGEAWRTAAHALEVIDNLCDAWRYLATMELKLAGWNAEQGGLLLRNPNVTMAQLGQIPARVGTWELVAKHGVTVTGASVQDYRDAVARQVAGAQAAYDFGPDAQARQTWAKSMSISRS